MNDQRIGLATALGAFLWWGVFGLYVKALPAIAAPELLAHRILGGMVFGALLLTVTRTWRDMAVVVRSGRMLRGLCLTSLLVGANWGLFMWAVGQGRALEASLGYFIFPLVSLVLARVFLGETMTRRQGVAVALVVVGVGWQMIHGAGVPWLALVLALTFGVYGLLRKTLPVSALAGLFAETAVMAPLAVVYLVWLGGGAGLSAPAGQQVLLALAGPVTGVPLILFALATRRLRLSTVGLMMYVNPTVQMLVAVFVFGEAFTSAHAVAFGAIWVGLAVYSWPGGKGPR